MLSKRSGYYFTSSFYFLIRRRRGASPTTSSSITFRRNNCFRFSDLNALLVGCGVSTSKGTVDTFVFYCCLELSYFMPHKQLDGEEWCCQYCHSYKDADYDKVVYHEVTQHHAGCPKK
jgi:hypothetical protein